MIKRELGKNFEPAHAEKNYMNIGSKMICFMRKMSVMLLLFLL